MRIYYIIHHHQNDDRACLGLSRLCVAEIAHIAHADSDRRVAIVRLVVRRQPNRNQRDNPANKRYYSRACACVFCEVTAHTHVHSRAPRAQMILHSSGPDTYITCASHGMVCNMNRVRRVRA